MQVYLTQSATTVPHLARIAKEHGTYVQRGAFTDKALHLRERAMKMLLAALTTILALFFALPINAAPVYVPKTEQARIDGLELVHKKKDWRRNYWRGNGHWKGNRHWRGNSSWNRRQAWRSCRYYGTCYPGRYYGYRDNYPRYYRRSGVSIFLGF
jgi:hypothetical protein